MKFDLHMSEILSGIHCDNFIYIRLLNAVDIKSFKIAWLASI